MLNLQQCVSSLKDAEPRLKSNSCSGRSVTVIGSGILYAVSWSILPSIISQTAHVASSSPGVVVANTESDEASLVVWLVSGVLAWTGASSFAELDLQCPKKEEHKPSFHMLMVLSCCIHLHGQRLLPLNQAAIFLFLHWNFDPMLCV